MEYDILVNQTHLLDPFWIPDNLVFVPSVTKHIDPNHQIYLNQEAYQYFEKMKQDSPIHIFIDSGYRSYDYQQYLVNYYYKIDGEKSFTYVALPGTSEHQTGLAIDIGFLDEHDGVVEIESIVDHPKELKWIHEHAHHYGFILRYPKGKEHITGYQYEPWHLRYVGIRIATEIYNNKETLDEYVKRKEDVDDKRI